MQTFLPFPDFYKSLQILDDKRLNKQKLESFQILNILLGRTESQAWKNHPAVLMWGNYENALKLYYNINIEIWINKGYNNNMTKEIINGDIIMPKWFGDHRFHDSHKSNLYRKDPIHYKQFELLGGTMEYFWPSKNGY